MLSFDISDRQLNVVKGVNANGRIKIDKSCTIPLEDNMVRDGEIIASETFSNLVTQVLKSENMWDKDAVITFSSNDIIFKELVLPNGKGEEILSMVTTHMHNEMNITNDYLISYSVVSQAENEQAGGVKVLATACSRKIVESYTKTFKMMGIVLKSVNIGCNSIARVILAEKSNYDLMPLLVIQIDPNFLGLTLFENNQLAYARCVPISAEDYESEDYLIEAIRENIFRMQQFNKARGGSGVDNVIIYGAVGKDAEYKKIIDSIEEYNVHVKTISTPSHITGFENFEFSDFANAIGALYKRNKQTEKINLLEVNSASGQSSEAMKQLGITAGIIVGASVVAILAIVGAVNMKKTQLQKEISVQEENIAAAQEILDANLIYKNQKTKIEDYNTAVQNARIAYESLPIMKSDLLEKIDNALKEAVDEEVVYTGYSYDVNGSVTLTNVVVSGSDVATQDRPREVVQKLGELGIFAGVTYGGYSGGGFSDTDVTISSLTLYLKDEDIPEIVSAEVTE